mgnify:FL=1
MFRVNENYLKLPGSYLFSTIAKKVAAYQKENPDKKLIRLGIGDVPFLSHRRSLMLCIRQLMKWDMLKPFTDMHLIWDMHF